MKAALLQAIYDALVPKITILGLALGMIWGHLVLPRRKCKQCCWAIKATHTECINCGRLR